MILLHSTFEPTILNYGELSIAIVTSLLVISVLRATRIIANPDRKVQVVDKQKDWLMEFQIRIFELTAFQLSMATTRYDGPFVTTGMMKNMDELKLKQLIRLDDLTNRVLFMFDT